MLRIGSADVDAVEIDRRILIFDGPGAELQQLALDLIGREFEVHYANDIDEAQMLARETAGRINAVLFSPGESICFVISSVLFEQDPLEIRYHRRVPTNLPARIEIGEAKSDSTIRDISLGGACLLDSVIAQHRIEKPN